MLLTRGCRGSGRLQLALWIYAVIGDRLLDSAARVLLVVDWSIYAGWMQQSKRVRIDSATGRWPVKRTKRQYSHIGKFDNKLQGKIELQAKGKLNENYRRELVFQDEPGHSAA